MATLTFLGEPGGSDSATWGGRVFEKGKAVEVDDQRMIAKAKNNRFFTVAGADDDDDKPIRQAHTSRADPPAHDGDNDKPTRRGPGRPAAR